jgi:hypothetical protein
VETLDKLKYPSIEWALPDFRRISHGDRFGWARSQIIQLFGLVQDSGQVSSGGGNKSRDFKEQPKPLVFPGSSAKT